MGICEVTLPVITNTTVTSILVCPAHRALIRFTAGNNVHYERVYSWLDDALKQDVSFAGSVVEDLGAWDSSAETLNIADSPKARGYIPRQFLLAKELRHQQVS